MATIKTTTAIITIAALFISFCIEENSAQAPSPANAPTPFASGPSSFGTPMAPSPFESSSGPSSIDGSSPPPTPDCMTNLLNMSDCLSYVSAGSKEKKPDPACCPEFAGLVDSAPQCLCTFLGGSVASQLGIKIDMKRALGLPSACNVSTPPVSLCSVIGAPIPHDGSLSPGAAPPGVLAAPPGVLAATPAKGIEGKAPTQIAGSAFYGIATAILLLVTTLFF